MRVPHLTPFAYPDVLTGELPDVEVGVGVGVGVDVGVGVAVGVGVGVTNGGAPEKSVTPSSPTHQFSVRSPELSMDIGSNKP